MLRAEELDSGSMLRVRNGLGPGRRSSPEVKESELLRNCLTTATRHRVWRR